MFMKNPKGQAAIEYLMNYAWAIALIIIVGVAIFSLNIGNLGGSLSGSGSGLSQQFEQVAIIGYTWGATHQANTNGLKSPAQAEPTLNATGIFGLIQNLTEPLRTIGCLLLEDPLGNLIK